MKEGASVEKDRPSPFVGIVLVAVAGLLAYGLLAFAGPCAHDAASCVEAQRVLLGMDAVLGVIALVRVFELDEGERRGLSFCAALVAALIAVTPWLLVELCAEVDMPCVTMMRPFVTCCGGAAFLVGAADLTRRLLALRK